MIKRSVISKWNQSRQRTKIDSQPLVHIGGSTTQHEKTEKENNNTAETGQRYTIPRQKRGCEKNTKMVPEDILQKQGIYSTCTETKRRRLQEQGHFHAEQYKTKKELTTKAKSRKQNRHHELTEDDRHDNPQEMDYYTKDEEEMDSSYSEFKNENASNKIKDYLMTLRYNTFWQHFDIEQHTNKIKWIIIDYWCLNWVHLVIKCQIWKILNFIHVNCWTTMQNFKLWLTGGTHGCQMTAFW